MSRLVVSEWMTLDGVFDADTMGEWFAPYDSPDRQGWIREGILAAAAFLVGRTTYELLSGYWPKVTDRHSPEIEVADRLNSAPKYVVSATMNAAGWDHSTIIRGDVIGQVTRLKQQAGRDILLLGSAALARSMMSAGLIDEYRFLVHPIVMGRGKRFFDSGVPQARLTLVASRALQGGVTSLTYRP